MVLRILVVAALILISACQQSPRKEYFALNTPTPPKNNETVSHTSAQNQAATTVKIIGVGPIIIPEYLAHTRISYWKTSNQLALQENHYWAEPLDQGVSRVLGLHLQTAHPNWRVVQFPWRNSQRPDYAIRVDIQRLDAFTDSAIIEAGLDLIDMKTNRVIHSKQFNARVNSAAHSAAIAEAFSELLQQTAVNMNELLPTTGSD